MHFILPCTRREDACPSLAMTTHTTHACISCDFILLIPLLASPQAACVAMPSLLGNDEQFAKLGVPVPKSLDDYGGDVGGSADGGTFGCDSLTHLCTQKKK